MKFIDEVEIRMKQFYTTKNCRGMSTIYTPKEVRDKMTVHAKLEMKILVMFNFEFCYDLWKMGCMNVMFVSDDELRNKIVEETWGFKTELIDPRDINKKINGMKFDLIISNPPYNNGIDLKILENVSALGDKICFIHPMTWLFDNKGNKRYEKLKTILNEKFVSVEPISSAETFGIGVIIDCGITFFDNSSVNKHDIFSYDLHGNDYPYTSIKTKILSYCQTISLQERWKSSNSKPYEIGFNALRGHGKYDLYTMLESQNQTKHFAKGHTPFSIKFGFDNEIEALNFKDYLKLKFTRFCLSIYKINRHVDNGELKSVPWLDYSKAWNDEECAKELGITNEELLWMINWIPDYYYEDVEIYKKLKEKLQYEN